MSKSREVTTLTLGATATRRRLRPLWDPGRASWRCRLLEREKTRAFMVGAHTFQDLARVEKRMSLTGTSRTFKLSVQSNVQVIT